MSCFSLAHDATSTQFSRKRYGFLKYDTYTTITFKSVFEARLAASLLKLNPNVAPCLEIFSVCASVPKIICFFSNSSGFDSIVSSAEQKLGLSSIGASSVYLRKCSNPPSFYATSTSLRHCPSHKKAILADTLLRLVVASETDMCT